MCLQTSCNQATRTFNWPRCILFLVPPRPPQLGFSRNACMHQFEMVKCDQPCIMYNTTQYQILYEYLPSSPSVSVCVCFHVFFFKTLTFAKKKQQNQSVSASVQIAQTCIPRRGCYQWSVRWRHPTFWGAIDVPSSQPIPWRIPWDERTGIFTDPWNGWFFFGKM